MKKYLAFFLPVICQTVVFYLFIIIPLEYFLTEKYSFLKFIHPQQKTTLFLIIFTIVFLANYCQPQIRKIGQRLGLVLMVFLIIALLADQAYTEFYQRLQENPKIYSLSSDWSIVGMEIEIDGKNFGPAWQAGKVTVDDFQMQVKDWAEEKIIILQPHLPRFFTGELCVEKYNGRVSNCFPFTIRNPGELHQE